jgi:hypothetical protein
MKRKHVIAITLLLLVVALSVVFLRLQKPVYFQYGTRSYKVVHWEVNRGTNIAFATDFRYKQWGRRQLDKVGIHLQGERSDRPLFRGDSRALHSNSYYLKVLCEGVMPSEAEYQNWNNREKTKGIEFLDENGKKFPVIGNGYHIGPPGHVWLLWNYQTSEHPSLLSTNDPPSVSPAPRQFRIVQKSNNQELLSSL